MSDRDKRIDKYTNGTALALSALMFTGVVVGCSHSAAPQVNEEACANSITVEPGVTKDIFVSMPGGDTVDLYSSVNSKGDVMAGIGAGGPSADLSATHSFTYTPEGSDSSLTVSLDGNRIVTSCSLVEATE